MRKLKLYLSSTSAFFINYFTADKYHYICIFFSPPPSFLFGLESQKICLTITYALFSDFFSILYPFFFIYINRDKYIKQKHESLQNISQFFPRTSFEYYITITRCFVFWPFFLLTLKPFFLNYIESDKHIIKQKHEKPQNTPWPHSIFATVKKHVIFFCSIPFFIVAYEEIPVQHDRVNPRCVIKPI